LNNWKWHREQETLVTLTTVFILMRSIFVCPIITDQFLMCPIITDQFLMCPIITDQFLICPIITDQFLMCLIITDQFLMCPVIMGLPFWLVHMNALVFTHTMCHKTKWRLLDEKYQDPPKVKNHLEQHWVDRGPLFHLTTIPATSCKFKKMQPTQLTAHTHDGVTVGSNNSSY